MRKKTCDAAFTYRMGAGFAGDVNRSHPFNIEAAFPDFTSPPTAYGQCVVTVAASNGVRPLAAGDSGLTAVYGITVRPFPLQQQSATNSGAVALGAGNTPPTNMPIDLLRSGYIVVQINPGQAAATKGGQVYVVTAATSGNRIQGQFETITGSGNIALSGAGSIATFNGPADANGLAEIAFNI